MLSAKCALEIRKISNEIDALLASKVMTQEQRKRADLLLAKLSNLRSAGISSEEMDTLVLKAWASEQGIAVPDKPETAEQRGERRGFRAFLRGKPELEVRTMLAGAQSVTYTEGPSGGYLVPQDFGGKVFEALAAYDGLLDDSVVSLNRNTEFRLLPMTLPAYDLSTFEAAVITEGAQQNEQVNPGVAKAESIGTTFRCRINASFEFEEDSVAYGNALNQMARAFGTGFSRGIGAAVVAGGGAIAGLLSAVQSSGVQLDPTIASDVSNTLNDKFQAAYFAVNRAYRVSPKCCWAMSDSTYQWIRSLTDKNGRPLLDIDADNEILMGKRVIICPSLPTYNSSPSVTGKILFGDFSYLNVRLSSMLLRRMLQYPGGAEYGKVAFMGLMRADAQLVAANNTSAPPIVSINVHP